jgi:hypothetical protein
MYTVATFTAIDREQYNYPLEYETSRFARRQLIKISPVFRSEAGAKQWADKLNVGYKIIEVEVMD